MLKQVIREKKEKEEKKKRGLFLKKKLLLLCSPFVLEKKKSKPAGILVCSRCYRTCLPRDTCAVVTAASKISIKNKFKNASICEQFIGL